MEEALLQLQFLYPQIKLYFGDMAAFLNAFFLVYYNQTNKVLTDLINQNASIFLLDPSNFRIDLNLLESTNGVIFEKPYSILNSDRETVYQVSDHQGIFGNSILDNLLLLESKPATIYYLVYETYQETKQMILMTIPINNVINKQIKLTISTPSTLVSNEKFNQLAFNLINGNRDNNKIGLPYYPIKLYFLQTSSPVLLNRAAIINSPITQVNTFNDINFLYYPKNSGWIVINQESATTETPLSLDIQSGSGVDRLIQVAAYTYYIAIDSDINLNIFRQSTNALTITPATFSNQLNMNINLSI